MSNFINNVYQVGRVENSKSYSVENTDYLISDSGKCINKLTNLEELEQYIVISTGMARSSRYKTTRKKSLPTNLDALYIRRRRLQKRRCSFHCHKKYGTPNNLIFYNID